MKIRQEISTVFEAPISARIDTTLSMVSPDPTGADAGFAATFESELPEDIQVAFRRHMDRGMYTDRCGRLPEGGAHFEVTHLRIEPPIVGHTSQARMRQTARLLQAISAGAIDAMLLSAEEVERSPLPIDRIITSTGNGFECKLPRWQVEKVEISHNKLCFHLSGRDPWSSLTVRVTGSFRFSAGGASAFVLRR